MLMVILKNSIPVVTVGLPRFSALCEWKCYLQMETERTCVYFCVVLHPLVPPKRHSPTSNPVVGKSYLNSCIFSSHTLSAIIDIVLWFFLANSFCHMVMENTMSIIPYLQWEVCLYYYEFLDKDSSRIKSRNNDVLGSKTNTEAANNRKSLILLKWVLHLWSV